MYRATLGIQVTTRPLTGLIQVIFKKSLDDANNQQIIILFIRVNLTICKINYSEYNFINNLKHEEFL